MHKGFALLWALPLAVGLNSCSTAEFKPRPIHTAGVYPAGTDQLLADAKWQFGLGNFALAIDQFRKAARQSPGSVDAFNGLAASYDRLGRFDLSRNYYEHALALAPENPKVRHNFAISLRMQGRQEEALAFEAEVAASVALPPVEGDAGPNKKPLQSRVSPALVMKDAPMPFRQGEVKRISMHEVGLVTKPLMQPSGGGVPTKVRVVPEEKTSPGMALLRVMNAVGRNGQASRMRAYLGNKGWSNIIVGNATARRNKSVIFYPVGSAIAARKIAGYLPFKVPILASRKTTHIILLLGNNAVPFDDRLLLQRKMG